ncbi:MAG: hypothetical protein ACRCVX_12650 [Shewanella sp.]
MKNAPWSMEVHELSEGFSAIIYDANGIGVLDHLSEDNARRIVAAVNATDGISTEALEHGCVAALVEAAGDYRSQFGQALEAHGISYTKRQADADEALFTALTPFTQSGESK